MHYCSEYSDLFNNAQSSEGVNSSFHFTPLSSEQSRFSAKSTTFGYLDLPLYFIADLVFKRF